MKNQMCALRQFVIVFVASFAFLVSGRLFLSTVCVHYDDAEVCHSPFYFLVHGATKDLPDWSRTEPLHHCWSLAGMALIVSVLYTGIASFLRRFDGLVKRRSVKLIGWAARFVIVVLLVSQGRSFWVFSVRSRPRIFPTAKTLGKCPDGHTTLKDVPIAYGLPPSAGHGFEEWEKAVDRLEFVPSGCVVSPDSPTTQVVCATCRLTYFGDGTWYGSSTNRSGFSRPFTALLLDLSSLSTAGETSVVWFTQMIKSNQLWQEGVAYASSRSIDQIKNLITDRLAHNQIHASFMPPKYNRWGGSKPVDYYMLAASAIEVELVHYVDQTNTAVSITHHLKTED